MTKISRVILRVVCRRGFFFFLHSRNAVDVADSDDDDDGDDSYLMTELKALKSQKLSSVLCCVYVCVLCAIHSA